LKQLQELNDERQALFGFTQEEQEAWKSPQVHSSTLMNAVNQARQDLHHSSPQQQQQEQHYTDYRQEEAIEQQQSSFPPQSSIIAGMKHDFTHLDSDNKGVNMVDVGDKLVTQRRAKAQSRVEFPPEVMAAFHVSSQNELVGPKGPIFAAAKIAGIMAAKYVIECRYEEIVSRCIADFHYNCAEKQVT
jgi:hypothetical protein